MVGTLALYDVVEWFKRAADPRASWEFTVNQIMNRTVITAQPLQPIGDLIPYFVEKSFNYIPVVDQTQLVGIISRADMIAALGTTYFAYAKLNKKKLRLMLGETTVATNMVKGWVNVSVDLHVRCEPDCYTPH